MQPKPWSPIPPGEQLISGISEHYPTRRNHGTCDYELLWTLSGCGRFAYADGSPAFTVRAGDAVLLHPRTPHDYRPEGPAGWRWIWVHFRPPPSWLPLLDWPEAAPGCGLLRADGGRPDRRLTERLHDIGRLALGSGPRRSQFAMNALEEVLLWCDARCLSRSGRPIDPRVRLVLDRLAQDLQTPCRRAELARCAGVSVSRLAALFQREMGTGIAQHRDRIRLERAAQLLRATSDSVARIAAEVGYDDPFHFSARFRSLTGLSPRAWRKQAWR